MKIWRIIRAILFVIFAAFCLVAGYFDFKYGNLSNKAMYVTFIISLVLCFPSLIKDIASPYTAKKEPKKFAITVLIIIVILAITLGCLYFFGPLKDIIDRYYEDEPCHNFYVGQIIDVLEQ